VIRDAFAAVVEVLGLNRPGHDAGEPEYGRRPDGGTDGVGGGGGGGETTSVTGVEEDVDPAEVTAT
jgi:hypothetical protein